MMNFEGRIGSKMHIFEIFKIGPIPDIQLTTATKRLKIESSNYQKMKFIGYTFVKNMFHDYSNIISDFQNLGRPPLGTRF